MCIEKEINHTNEANQDRLKVTECECAGYIDGTSQNTGSGTLKSTFVNQYAPVTCPKGI